MKLHVSILLSFLSTSAFISSPALSMRVDDDPVRIARKGKKEEIDLDALIKKCGISEKYQSTRGTGNKAPDDVLVSYLLGKKWDKLSPEEQSIIVAKVTGKPVVSSLDTFIAKSGVVAIFKDLRAKKNTAPDKELIGYILKDSGWSKLSPEEQAIIVSKVTGKPTLDAFIAKSGVVATYNDLRARKNMTPDKELIGYILRNSGWDKLSTEEQAIVVAKVTGTPVLVDLGLTKLTGKDQDLADMLRKLNPEMEDIIANAWADLAKDQDLSLMLGEHYSDEDLTYTLQQPGNPVRVPYYQHLMPRHELSGYYALSLTPKRVLGLLEANILGAHGPTRFKEIIAEKLIADLKENKLPAFLRDNKEIMVFLQQLIAKEAEVATWVEVFNDFLGRGTPGKEALQANDIREELFTDLPEDIYEGGVTVSEGLFLLHNAKEDLAKSKAKLKDLCMNDKLLLDYITAQISPREDILKGIKERRQELIVTAIANIMNFNLNIYQPVADGSHDLELVQSYLTPGAVKQFNLLYANGHFDRLETKLHRHVVPATEFQDPFAQYRGREATGGTMLAIGEELKKIDRVLFPEGDTLRKELHNLTGYGGENKDAFIEGYQEEERVKGHYVTQAAAEAEYNKRVKDFEDKIAEGDKTGLAKKNPTFIYTHLSKAFGGDTPIAKELENALETMAVCTLPKIVYPKGIKIHNQGMVRRTILEHWDREYVVFEIKEDGLYGTKAEDAAPKTFEKILKFADGKVEIVRAEDTEGGIQRFYLQDPSPDDIRIFDEMLVDVRQLCPTLNRAVSLINDVKRLFEMRPALLEQAAKGVYNELTLTSHTVHLSYSDPNNRYSYDRVSAPHRLNNIHNSIVQSYLTAKKRGDVALKHYFDKTMSAPGYCLDGASRDFHDYMRDVLEKDAPPILPKEKFIEEKLNELIKLPGELTRASIRAAFGRFLNAPTLQGPFEARDINRAIKMAEEWDIL